MANKKAAVDFEFLIMVILIAVAAVLIFAVWGKFIEKVDAQKAEKLCEMFNTERMKLSLNPAGHKITFVPNSCNTIHKTGKNSLPESSYAQTTEGLKDNIKRLIVKSWDMWLKGYEPNILDATWFSGQDRCFITYIFNIKEGIPQLNSNDLIDSLHSIYIAKDASDKCALTDLGLGGGYCMSSCKDAYPVETNSVQCTDPNKNKCCISAKLKDECINKGGKCQFQPCDSNSKEYTKPAAWKCADENNRCCVKNENIYSYLDYVQFSGGPGNIAVNKNMNFCAQNTDCTDTYAVVFVAQTSSNILLKYFEGAEASGILIAPLNEISGKCIVAAEASGK